MAFSRVDLLAVLAVLALIALITRASIASATRTDAQAICLDNLRELTRAWTAHAIDHEGALVSASQWTGGQWLSLPVSSPSEIDPYAPEGIASSPLWQYTGNQPQIWRCPEDTTTGSHPDYQNGAPAPRVRSYSMNGWVGGPAWAGQTGWKVYTKLDDFQVPGPSGTFILIGERPESINDGYFGVDMIGFKQGSPQNPQARIIDYPASYHSGGASISYMDGRAEVNVWKDPRTVPPPEFIFPLNVASPGNPDVYWLQYRTTRRVEQANALRFGSPRVMGEDFRAAARIQDGHDYDLEVSNDLVNWKKAGLIQSGEESEASVEMNINDNTTRQFFRARRRE
jgi:hypothetical protein